MIVFECGNVINALDRFVRSMREPSTPWIERVARGQRTLEMALPVCTVYHRPWERVLFSHARDANPFFHLFEAIWILAGRSDVSFLSRFNSNIAQYSDDGITFHAPYGYRLRWSMPRDQILGTIKLLKEDPDTRRAVMTIWEPERDLGTKSKDIPCNVALFFKIVENHLRLTVCCRSNDAIWGAYGANAVQFSMIQQLIAEALEVQIGEYRQISDSFHYYPDVEVAKRISRWFDFGSDLYAEGRVYNAPMLCGNTPAEFLAQCSRFCSEVVDGPSLSGAQPYNFYFENIVLPMFHAWKIREAESDSKRGALKAMEYIDSLGSRWDWLEAAAQWLHRRS